MSDDLTVPMYKNNLKKAIKQQGFKLHEISDKTGIPLRSLTDYCAGRVPMPQQRLEVVAQFIGCSVSYIRGDNIALERQPTSLGNDEMNRKRRTLLQTLGIAGSAILCPLDMGWDNFNKAVENPSYIDEEFIHNLESINNRYWSMFLSVSPKAIVLDGVLGQLNLLIKFLKESHPTPTRKKLCGLASSLSQLSGEIFFDLSDYTTAQLCYMFASSSAKEAGQYDLWACSLIRQAFLPLYEGSYSEALTLLQEGRRISRSGDTTLVTRFWVAAVEAEAQAGLRNFSACQTALADAHSVLALQEGSNGSWLRFDGSRLSELQGACFVRLQKPDLALKALKEALIQNAKPTRRRGMVLTDMALASIQRGEIEQACTYANEVVDIAVQGSGVVKRCIHSLQAQFTSFVDVDVVIQLNQRIKSLV